MECYAEACSISGVDILDVIDYILLVIDEEEPSKKADTIELLSGVFEYLASINFGRLKLR